METSLLELGRGLHREGTVHAQWHPELDPRNPGKKAGKPLHNPSVEGDRQILTVLWSVSLA